MQKDNPSIAQTSYQLIDQLVAQGMDKTSISRVIDCCSFAEEFSAAAYRATGRPFYNHLVGVGSITARETNDPAIIGAAVIHGMYELGRLPRWIFRPSEKKAREIIRERLGVEIEELAFSYSKMGNKVLMDPKRNRTELESKILLMRLADILENVTEKRSALGTLKVVDFDPDAYPGCEETYFTLASQVGADWISDAYSRTAKIQIDPIAITDKSRTYYRSKWKLAAFRKKYLPL
jgi:hypothetical protein